MRYMEHIVKNVNTLEDNVPPSLLLVMARLCLDLETNTIRYNLQIKYRFDLTRTSFKPVPTCFPIFLHLGLNPTLFPSSNIYIPSEYKEIKPLFVLNLNFLFVDILRV